FYIHHGKDWYLRIIPRLIHRAGFELGTGISVNIIDPADAADILKEEKPK
ncbi:MAG: Galactose-1-phosphate uridylyltransferase, partial [Candidatus Woesebacteria bacterium GW2011_GWB1_41_10]